MEPAYWRSLWAALRDLATFAVRCLAAPQLPLGQPLSNGRVCNPSDLDPAVSGTTVVNLLEQLHGEACCGVTWRELQVGSCSVIDRVERVAVQAVV